MPGWTGRREVWLLRPTKAKVLGWTRHLEYRFLESGLYGSRIITYRCFSCIFRPLSLRFGIWFRSVTWPVECPGNRSSQLPQLEGTILYDVCNICFKPTSSLYYYVFLVATDWPICIPFIQSVCIILYTDFVDYLTSKRCPTSRHTLGTSMRRSSWNHVLSKCPLFNNQ